MPRFRRLKRSTERYAELLKSARFYRLATAVSLALVILMTALPLIRLQYVIADASFIPLHYNIYFGVDRFGPWYHLFIMPGIGLGLLFLNLGFQARYFQTEKILGTFFALSTLVAEIILLVGVVFAVLLNL